MFNLVSLNVNGLNDHLKRTALIDWLKCMKADIVCLQETHASSHESIRKWFANSGYRVASSCHTNKSAGTAILVQDTHKISKIIKDDAGRFVQVLINFDDDQLSFVSIYAPNRNPERNAFLLSLTDLVDLSRPVFIAGDFNCVLDPLLDRKRRPSFVGGPSAHFQESGPALNALLTHTQTYPLWRDLHAGRIAYSWTHGSGTFASRIDMVWAPLTMADLIQECEYHPSFLSDHQYLLVKCLFRDRITTGPGVWKFNTSLLQDSDYHDLVTSFWAFWQTMSDHPDFASQLDWWDQGKFYLRDITRSFSKAKAVRARSKKTLLNKQLRELQRLFEAGDHAAFSKLCAVQQELRGIALHEARGAQVRARCQWAEEGETSSSFFLNLASHHHAKASMPSIRDPDTGMVHHDPFEILGVWRRNYSSLFTAQQCDPATQDEMLQQLTRRLSPAERNGCEGCLTLEECFAALNGMP